MGGYNVIRIPNLLAKLIDKLVKNGEYPTRTAFVNEVIRKEFRTRNLLPSE